MFVYEKNGAINVTFKGNRPVENPEYVIVIDKEAGTIAVNGSVIEVAATEDSETTSGEETTTTAPAVEEEIPEDTEVVDETEDVPEDVPEEDVTEQE